MGGIIGGFSDGGFFNTPKIGVAMPLTDSKVGNIKPKTKPFKIFDEKGLYLLVTVQGSKCWRLKYRLLGKEKVLAIGLYPDISLAEARDKRDVARKQLANDIDPSVFKKASKNSDNGVLDNSFEAVARAGFAKREKIRSIKSVAEKNGWLSKNGLYEHLNG